MNEPRKKWILVAEGEPHDEQLIVHSLGASRSPPEVVVVHDGSQALDCLYRRDCFEARQTGNPAVVLLDLQLPRVGGLEVLRQVKGDAQLSIVPVVVLASCRDASNVARCYQLGANACVIKPLVLRRYAAALQEVSTFWALVNEPPPQGRSGIAEESPARERRASGAWPSG